MTWLTEAEYEGLYSVSEERFITDYDKSWISGKIATFSYSAYTALDVDRGPVDKETWDLQHRQALEYKTTGSAGTLLKLLADSKSVSVANLADCESQYESSLS